MPPDSDIFARRSDAPVLLIINVCVVVSPICKLALSEAGETPMTGGNTPTPERGRFQLGFVVSLLVIVNVTVCKPVSLGAKVTTTG